MKTIHESDDAVLQFDKDQAIIFITWKGNVSEESVIKVMSQAAKASYFTETMTWLIDRRDLLTFDPGARIWVKNDFVNKIGKELIKKTTKIAVLAAHDPMAQLSSNVLVELVREHNQKIDFKVFDMPTPAKNWLLGVTGTDESPKPKKKKGFFNRR